MVDEDGYDHQYSFPVKVAIWVGLIVGSWALVILIVYLLYLFIMYLIAG